MESPTEITSVAMFHQWVTLACQQYVDDGNATSIESIWHDMALSTLSNVPAALRAECRRSAFGS